MKITHMGLVALTTLALACGDNNGGSGGGADEVEVPEVEVPSIEEAEADAEAAITEENADKEFAKLQAEIESDG